MVTNLLYFFETAKKVRGGRWVWVKDGNGESRNNILLGGTIANPNKGFGHLWAGQLMQYTPGQPMLIFRSFKLQANAAGNATTIYLDGDGFSDAPEVGQYLMVAPQSAATSGTYAKVTDVEYDEANLKFKVVLANKLSSSQRQSQQEVQRFFAQSQTYSTRQTATCFLPMVMVSKTQTTAYRAFTTSKRGLKRCSHSHLMYLLTTSHLLMAFSGFNHLKKRKETRYGKCTQIPLYPRRGYRKALSKGFYGRG